jgi:hypothetical protein
MCVYVCICKYKYVVAFVYSYICLCIYVCVYIRMHICVYMCIYIHILCMCICSNFIFVCIVWFTSLSVHIVRSSDHTSGGPWSLYTQLLLTVFAHSAPKRRQGLDLAGEFADSDDEEQAEQQIKDSAQQRVSDEASPKVIQAAAHEVEATITIKSTTTSKKGVTWESFPFWMVASNESIATIKSEKMCDVHRQ